MEDTPDQSQPARPLRHPPRGRVACRRSPAWFRRRDRVAQLQPLTATDLRGRVVLVNFWTYTCINWLRTLPYVRAWADQVQGPGPDRDRRPHPRVRLRARPRQRPPRGQGPGGRLPGRDRQRLRDLDRLQQPLLAGAVLRRRPGPDPPPPLRRGRLRDVRDDPATAPDRGRQRRHRPGTGLGRRPWGGSRRRLGQLAVARELPRLRAHRQLRLTQWFHPGYELRLCRPHTAGTQPLGSLG